MPIYNYPAFNLEVSPDAYMMPNRLDFQDWVQNTFKYKKRYTTEGTQSTLFNHQRFVKDYMQYDSPFRGIMLYHGLGVGKTRSSIAVAETLQDYVDVIVMLPASLETNFRIEIQKCGNPLLRTQQNWTFLSLNSEKYKSKLKKIAELQVTPELITKMKGVWFPDPKKEPNYSDLENTHRAQLDEQLQDMISNRYNFMRYNGGIKLKQINDMIEEAGGNPFDNKAVIIDEVHNFVSMVHNGSVIGKKLYQLLLEAVNLKIILLSGTPIINNAIELAYITNLLSGYLYNYRFVYKEIKPSLQERLIKELSNNEYIDSFSIQHDVNSIFVSFLPEGFRFTNKEISLVERAEEFVETQDIINLVKQILISNGVTLSNKPIKKEKNYLLPLDEDAFDKLFVNYTALNNDDAITNPILLSRRLQGLFSYYEKYDSNDYPLQNPVVIEKIKMSNYQFLKYFEVRSKEIESELNSKSKKTQADELKKGNVYRSLSRAYCNFVFPGDIERPYPKKIQNMRDEIDIDEGEAKAAFSSIDESDESSQEQKSYAEALNESMNKLKENAESSLTGRALSMLSPKFERVKDNLKKTNGTSLIYSTFRNVEGIRILSYVLDAHGYVEVKLRKNAKKEWTLNIDEKNANKKKYIIFESKKEETKILLNLFNSEFDQLPQSLINQLRDLYGTDVFESKNLHGEIIQTLMITQSGSEGISLKNVRQVHILEPYWNDIRIKQVIGRAIRAKSHISLPPDERIVDVFLYMMELTTDQKKENTIKAYDKGLTSDEHIYNIAQRKAQIINNLLNVVKRSSVDCFMHNIEGDCFKSIKDKTRVNKKMYEIIDATKDIKNADLKKMTKKAIKKTTFIKLGNLKGISMVMNKETQEIFKEDDKTIAIGKVTQISDDGIVKKVKWYK